MGKISRIGRRLADDRWKVAMVLAVAAAPLGACGQTCGMAGGLAVAQADIAKKNLNRDGYAWRIYDRMTSWVVESVPPPGAGGRSFHEVDKKQCTLKKVDILL